MSDEREVHKLRTRTKWLERQVSYLARDRDYQRKKREALEMAWSRIHPIDMAYMRSTEDHNEIPDVYNRLIYSFGRTQPDGTVHTRFSTVWDWFEEQDSEHALLLEALETCRYALDAMSGPDGPEPTLAEKMAMEKLTAVLAKRKE